MKPVGIVGIILIAIGIIALAYGGFTYTKREKLLETPIGDVTAKKEHTVPFPPILGGACLVGGIILVLAGNRKT
jgi:hypothetical protein